MPDPITTHPFVRGVLASLCHDADGPLMPEHGLGRARLPETLRHLYRAPGVRFAGRGGRERPLSRDGAVTCHFSQTSVSKTSPILARIRAAKAGRCYQGSRAVAHEAYIERPGAAERLGPARSRRATGRDGREQQAYLERDGAVEADPDAALALASFGTIGDTPEERARFWTLVEESERSARGDRIRIAPGRDPDWWARALSAIDAAPEAARATLRAAGPQRSAPLTLTLPTEDAFALWRWAIGLGADAPVAIAPGRGGRIQTRIIAELPHEIDARQRLAIVEAFTGKLEAKGFPYWAVVHAPDERNDARNVHVHIVYYDRPARRMPHPDTGAPTWDFAITCERRRANRTRVLTRPYRQPKDRASHDRTWIGELRANWGACCNAVLAEAGIAKRYDLRAYATIGIGQAPGVHIPARQYNKERKGALTEAGADLARRQWQAEADRILEARAAATGTQIGLFLQRGRQAEFAVPSRGAGQSNAAARAGIGDPGEPVRALIRRGLALVVEIGRLELARDLARLVCARTLSRPRLLLAASTVLKHARGAKADPGGITGEDPPVPEGAPFGLARRSALAGLCERLDRGAGQLAAAYEARIADASGRLDRIRADLSLAGRTPLMDSARAGSGSAEGPDLAITTVPIDPVPEAEFAARVRASLEPATAVLWHRYDVGVLQTTEAVTKAPSPAIASIMPTPNLRPATKPPTEPPAPVAPVITPASSWSDAVARAAERHGKAQVDPIPALRPLQPQYELARPPFASLGGARRSNGAPLTPAAPRPKTDRAGAEAADPGGGQPLAWTPEARRASSLTASAMPAPLPAPEAARAIVAESGAPSAATTPAAPPAAAPMSDKTAVPPAVPVPARPDSEVTDTTSAPVAVAVETDAPSKPAEPAPAPAEIVAGPATADTKPSPIQSPQVGTPAIRIEPELQLPALQLERAAQVRAERSSTADESITDRVATGPQQRNDEDDAPWPGPPQDGAPDPAPRVAPPARPPAEAPPLRVPLSAVHGADEAAATGERRASRRQHAPQPKRNGRDRGGRGIGD